MCSRVQPTKSVLHVDRRSSALQDAKGLDHGWLHAVLGLVDLEVAQRALGLSSPVLAGIDLELAEGIGLASGVGGHLLRGSKCANVAERGSGLVGEEGGRAVEGSASSDLVASACSDCGEGLCSACDRAGQHGGQLCEGHSGCCALLMRVAFEVEGCGE
jgi:hypothetical protein